MTAKPVSSQLRRIVTERARGCCEYCQSQEIYSTQSFSVEHITPVSKNGETTADNLALACQGWLVSLIFRHLYFEILKCFRCKA